MVKFNSCLRMLGSALLTMAICFGFNAAADSGSTRTIHLRQSDAQTRFESKIYQLKSDKRFNALKYVHIFHRYKNIVKGDPDVKFLGL